jgi:hypothetical protein
MAIPAALPDNARDELKELHRTSRQDGGSDAFDAALHAFNLEGWSFRQLGDALGLSHESVRQRAKRAAEVGAPVSEVSIPSRVQALDIIPAQTLHTDISTDLNARLEAALMDQEERLSTGLKPAVADFFHAMHAAREAGWDEYSIAAGIGSHPKAIFKFIAQHERHGDRDAPGPSYPAAPAQDLPLVYRSRRPEVPPVTVPEEDIAELRLLEDLANVEKNASAAAMHREVLGGWYLRGGNRAALEEAAGVGWETVRKRLARAGYMTGRPR